MQRPGLTIFSSLLLPALAVSYQESDIRNVNALIIGPPETPYEFGFFEVCSHLLRKCLLGADFF